MAPRSPSFLLLLFFFLSSSTILHVHPQQPYEGLATTDCENPHNSTSLLGYFCAPRSPSCSTYLTFRALPPYDSVAAVSSLLAANPSLLSQSNSLPSASSAFPIGAKLSVPVACSCSDGYYQSDAPYTVKGGDTAFLIANNTFQALSTCQAITARNLNNISSTGFVLSGANITVPLRCACPSSNQTRNGVKYLMSYLVDPGDTIYIISRMFGVQQQSILDANALSNSNNIYPFTTLLIPLSNPPNASQLISASPPPPPLTAASPPTHKSSKRGWIFAVAGVAAAALVVAAAAPLVLAILKASKKRTYGGIRADESKINYKDDRGSTPPAIVTADNADSSSDIRSRISGIRPSLKIYKFRDLKTATENFSSERQIDGGSSYRAVLDGEAVAVRKVDGDVTAQISVLKQISHFNLNKLHGLCFNKGYWYLVHEQAQNGRLSKWLFKSSDGFSAALNWRRRVLVALDVAEGLHYLHSFCKPAYVHMDICCTNILLDSNFRAKISNFSRARPAQEEEGDFALTTHIVGKSSHMAPEYIEHGLVSPKIDVYAFGVVLMEMITGREASEVGRDAVTELLRGGETVAGEEIKGFIDQSLEWNYTVDSAMFMVELIEKCLRRDARSRPSMGEVAQSLSKVSAMLESWNSSSDSQSFSSGRESLAR
ncbi:lysM domain receptor-like kinase 4 [Ananas comosus]|uniref:LysM domain receptor-like kinase 4 n=1 Tax=Ananas comosus TaxID=4615 RepID=A0A199UUC6_ANACO|nr:lysM domain receptor-like kinase 4 [Ananas comosus]OAY68236.1 LysM domain receptor-like kinase 4 [Ananas comosus]